MLVWRTAPSRANSQLKMINRKKKWRGVMRAHLWLSKNDRYWHGQGRGEKSPEIHGRSRVVAFVSINPNSFRSAWILELVGSLLRKKSLYFAFHPLLFSHFLPCQVSVLPHLPLDRLGCVDHPTVWRRNVSEIDTPSHMESHVAASIFPFCIRTQVWTISHSLRRLYTI